MASMAVPMKVRSFVIAAGVVLMGFGLAGMFRGGYPEEWGLFGMSAGLNVIYILTGGFAIIAGLASTRAAAIYCLIFGIVNGLLAVFGFLHIRTIVDAINLTNADDLLHLVLAGACLW